MEPGTEPPPGPAGAAAPADPTAFGVSRLTDTELDAGACYFVSYDGLVNNGSFQQSGILSYRGYQYAAWYTATRHATLARRRLPGGEWRRVRLPHRLTVDDSHNVISLGVSPVDGRLHVAMDTHDSTVYYVRSEPGLVNSPDGRRWRPGGFGPVRRDLDGLDLGAITYPRFVTTPDGRLQLGYRTGGSGNGTLELAEYTDSWRRLGRWQSATGSYRANGATSSTRNMYLHGLGYGPDGRLHAAFTWREGNPAVVGRRGGLSNHDTGYVYSDDQGRTWRNGAGQLVGATGTPGQVSIASPGLVVDPLGPEHALMNQESQDVDSAGQPHIVISYVPGRFGRCGADFVARRIAGGRAFHLWRESSGTWRKAEIPVPLNAFGRSQVVLGAADDCYVVLPHGRIVTASRASGYTDWTPRFDGAGLNAFGEVLVDRGRIDAEGVLSILYQRASTGTTPSSLRVLDVRLGCPAGSAARPARPDHRGLTGSPE